MLKMMIAFFRDLFKYRGKVSRQKIWMGKYVSNKGYTLNPSWMMSTNLAIWLTEMEETFGKRYCPCFEPSGDSELDRKMLCPCEFIEQDIEAYGTCHCALFGRGDLDKAAWNTSSARLQAEYRVPLKLEKGVLETRGRGLDPFRNLPIPDAMHQVKSALNGYSQRTLTVLVATDQEADNLEQIARYRGYGFEKNTIKDGHRVVLTLK